MLVTQENAPSFALQMNYRLALVRKAVRYLGTAATVGNVIAYCLGIR